MEIRRSIIIIGVVFVFVIAMFTLSECNVFAEAERDTVLNQKYGTIKAIEIKDLTTGEKKELLSESDNIDYQKSKVTVIKNKLIEGDEEELEVIGDIALGAKALPSGSAVIETGERAYMKIKAVIGYKNKKFDGITHVKGLFFGGRVVSQSNSVAVQSLKGLYHENGAYRTFSGGQGYITDYKQSKKFKVDDRYKWQYKTVDFDRYFNTAVPYQALQTRFTVKGTVNGKAFTFNLTSSRLSA